MAQLTGEKLEAAREITWRGIVAAINTKDKAAQLRLVQQFHRLNAQRTPEQAARGLVVAELTAAGTCAHPRKQNGLCLKCKAVIA